MQIKRLVIENFKSIERIELIKPNPFTVFVGPNGSGKSNIFEALEFVNVTARASSLSESLFGGKKVLTNRNNPEKDIYVEATLDKSIVKLHNLNNSNQYTVGASYSEEGYNDYLFDNRSNHHQFPVGFSRLFLRRNELQKLNLIDNQELSLSADNLELVLKRLLSSKNIQEEIFEWLELFVPGFKAVEIDDRDELHWFEESVPGYFTKDLISDGTYNTLALLTAVYQSDEPQFLCIEEPENGLHPDVIKEFVNLSRYNCEQKGHFIWLNTHSQTLASQLTADEIVVVNKVEGATQTKQFKGRDFHGLRMDEAWLMNVLGGGLPF